MGAVHEPLAADVHEHRALAADRLRDQERRRVLFRENGRMELHVFQVDKPGAHAVRHGDPVAHAAGLVCRVQEDLAEPPACQHRLFRDDG